MKISRDKYGADALSHRALTSGTGAVRLALIRAVNADGSVELVGSDRTVLVATRLDEQAIGSFAVCLDLDGDLPVTVVIGAVGMAEMFSALQDATDFNKNRGDAEPIVFRTGRSQLVLQPDGRIRIKGDDVKVESLGRMKIEGAVIDLN